MTSTRYPELTVSGSPRNIGRQIGDAARDQIRSFCEIALSRVNKTMRVSAERAAKMLVAAEESLVLAHTAAVAEAGCC